MPVRRQLLWGLVAVSGLVFVGSGLALGRRIGEFNRTSNLARFHAQVEEQRELHLEGYPPLRLSDAVDDRGRPAIRLEYGDTTRLIPAKAPPAPNLPTLAGYDEWAKVLAVNQVGLDANRHSVAVPGTDRLLIVSRRTPEGFDPDTWGSVRRDEWVFDFYDLRPDGSIVESVRRWPRTDMGEERFSQQAAASDDKGLKALAAIPPLEERSIEYFAAMHVIPKLNVPKHKFSDTALNPRVLGWTLPVNMLSGLVLVPALFFAIVAPKRRPG